MAGYRYGLVVACLSLLPCWLIGEAFIHALDPPPRGEDEGGQVIVCPRPVIESTFVYSRQKDKRPFVNRLAFSPDAKYLVSNCRGWAVNVWDMLEREEWEDTKYLRSTNGWGCVNIWDMIEGKARPQEASLNGKATRGGWLEFIPNLEGISPCYKTEGQKVFILQLPSMNFHKRVPYPSDIDWMDQVAMSPDASTLAFFGIKTRKIGERPLNRFILHDLVTGKARCSQEIEEGATAASFTPDGKSLGVIMITGGLVPGWEPIPPYFLRLYDARSGRVRSTIIVSQKWTNYFRFTSDSKRAAVLCEEGIKIFQLSSGAQVMRLANERSAITSFAFYPGASFLFAGCSDGSIQIWNLEARKVVHTLKSHKKAVTALAFSRGGKWLASGGEDGKIKLWNCSDWH